MVKRDERGPRFDDGTSKNEIGGPEGDNATLVDEALGQEVAIKLRELRKEMAKQSSAKAEKPTFTEEDFPRLYSEDDAPTMWEVNSGPSIMELEQQTIEAPAYAEGSLGSAIPVVLSDDAEHTQRSEIPIIEPIKPPPLEERAEYTRKEPIPMELFFETSEQRAVPMSARPSKPAKLRGRTAGPVEVVPVGYSPPIEEPSEPAERTMLDVAAVMGIAPEVKPIPDEDTFDEVKDAVREAVESVEEEKPKEEAKLPLPLESLDLAPFVEEEQQKAKRAPREGMGSQDIRRMVTTADAASRVIPITLAVFVVVATLYAIISIFSGIAQKKDEHVELRFLATLDGRPSELISKQGAKTVRLYIETTPPELLVLHNRAILGKTPLTIDLPIELGEVIGVELSSPYYETWISQVKRDHDEYRILAELKEK